MINSIGIKKTLQDGATTRLYLRQEVGKNTKMGIGDDKSERFSIVRRVWNWMSDVELLLAYLLVSVILIAVMSGLILGLIFRVIFGVWYEMNVLVTATLFLQIISVLIMLSIMNEVQDLKADLYYYSECDDDGREWKDREVATTMYFLWAFSL